MLTRDMAAPMMRRGGRRMRQMQELRTEIERLQNKCNRLVDAFVIAATCADRRRTKTSPYYPDMMGEQSISEMGLHPGDLDPEPHDMPEGEQ